MSSKKVNHDPFCWKCCRDKTNRQCSECERSFHGDCIDAESEQIDSDKGWICPVCTKIKSATIVDKQKGLEMLAIIMKRVYNDSAYTDFRAPPKNGNKKGRTDDTIVKPMNLNTLKEKMAKYQNYEQFLADVEWIVHNCLILHTESHEKSRVAKNLLNYFTDEIESVKKCAECYANATTHSDTWFTLACNKPHLLIWAKQKGFNYWPAKLMSIDGLLINVRFFGDHTHADIPANNCFLYSKTNPGRLKHTSNLYNGSLTEASKYITNIRKKFGTFNLVDDRNSIDPTKYEDYMAEAFPDLVQYRREKIDEAASAENLVEMEHIELPSLDYNDEMDNGGVDHIDTASHSSRDDVAFDQRSVASNRSNSELVVKLDRIDTTLSKKFTSPINQNEKSKSNEFDQVLNKDNGGKEADSTESDDDDENEWIQNTDSNVAQQLTATHEANDIERDASIAESSGQQENNVASENGNTENGSTSTENDYPAEKRARLMQNDDVNGRPWPTAAARKADNSSQKDANVIETITTPPTPPPPPSPPSPHQSPEIDPSNTNLSNVVETNIFNLISSVESTKKIVEKYIFQRQTMERDLQRTIHELQRTIVDYEGKLKRTNDEKEDLKNQLEAKGACDFCGKSSKTVFYCDADCRAMFVKRLTESHAKDVGQKKNQMDTDLTK